MKTHLGGSFELVLGCQRDGNEVLVGVDERVRDAGDGGVVEGEREAGNLLNTQHKSVNQDVLLNVQDFRSESLSSVENLNNAHTVGERRDVQHVQQHGFGRSDTGTSVDDLDVRDNLNRTTSNLGGDSKRLEEGRLTGLHSRVSGRDNNIGWGETTGTSRGGDSVCENSSADILEVTRREHEANVALDKRHQPLKLGLLGQHHSERSSDHGVLAHQHRCLSSQRGTDLVHLLGSDIVDVDDKDGGVGVEELVELDEPGLLGGTRDTHC